MPPVFAHGRLRLYLLKLLDEAPRHGYEVIRLLEERFHGLYAPSAGTVYPRLAKLEAEGLVTHATEGGRKVYSLTDAGRAELAGRGGELADLEREIRDSVSELAAEIRDDVRGAAGTLRREMRAAAGETRTPPAGGDDWAAWRRAKQEWKDQARRAKDESRRAREDARAARQEMQRIAQQVQDHVMRGEGLADLAGRLGGLLGGAAPPTPPEWAHDSGTSADPARDLERLLDRFRDDIRDAARDHGVTATQLAEARRHLSTASAHIVALLKGPGD
ncbi:PadR family transcriptional regulator [Streptomyces sp. CB03234]|uniref:PadR family transcriptional regulator n=1 Tax=Streptomyces sp. (strain CB03234) TaxID=1703937 RepID=UPI00093A1E06|nr:PadR family transcriptional regulator [Streptomyces sp. CB03234]OKK06468.1 PadR family transcriptional regulator [Streptomyces sp. CB03234]